MEKTITLRVLPSVALPHTISRKGVPYTFAPDADVPEELGRALIKTYPNLYQEAKGKADLDRYTFTDQFKAATIDDVLKKLPEEQKLQVFEFAKQLATGKAPAEDAGGAEEPTREQLVAFTEGILQNFSVEELKGFIERRKIELPAEVTNKGQIVAYLADQLTPGGKR
jgi:hypothetical protein